MAHLGAIDPDRAAVVFQDNTKVGVSLVFPVLVILIPFSLPNLSAIISSAFFLWKPA